MTDEPTDLVDIVASMLGDGRMAVKIDALYAARIEELEAENERLTAAVDGGEREPLDAYNERFFPRRWFVVSDQMSYPHCNETNEDGWRCHEPKGHSEPHQFIDPDWYKLIFNQGERP